MHGKKKKKKQRGKKYERLSGVKRDEDEKERRKDV